MSDATKVLKAALAELNEYVESRDSILLRGVAEEG